MTSARPERRKGFLFNRGLYALHHEIHHKNLLPAQLSFHIFAGLKPPRLLNVDADYTQDTSLVVRWRNVAGAGWYRVFLEPNVTGVTGIGENGVVNEVYAHIKNLRPGTMYKISVTAMNAWEFPTESERVSIMQATRKYKISGMIHYQKRKAR